MGGMVPTLKARHWLLIAAAWIFLIPLYLQSLDEIVHFRAWLFPKLGAFVEPVAITIIVAWLYVLFRIVARAVRAAVK